MRTRFLTTNYFTSASSSSSSSSSGPQEKLNCLHLPVPRLPPPDLCNLEDILCSSFHSVLSSSLTLDGFPIDAALSRLFSDVLPHVIDGIVTGVTYDVPESFRAGGAEIRYLEEGTKTITIDARNENKFQIVQFDTPELDTFLENAWLFENEEMQIPLEVPSIGSSQDMLKPGFRVQCPYLVLESVYSVEDIIVDYPMYHNPHMLEDDSSVQDQIHCCHKTFPLLEVDEISLGISTAVSMDDELLLHFESIESNSWTQREDLIVDGREILGSLKIDMLEYLSGHCSSKQYLKLELTGQNLPHEMDTFMSTLEIAHFGGNSEFPLRIPDSFAFSSLIPICFEEFQILDTDLSQFLEVFSMSQIADKPGAYEQLFVEHVNVNNFDEMIVSHELALVDDTFKALPIPGCLDHEKMMSVHAIAEDILVKLKPQPLSASDGIYLDWHLLEEERCNSVIYSSYQKMFEGIDTYSIDSNVKTVNFGMLVLDILFSGDTSDAGYTEESKESLNIVSSGNSMLHEPLIGGTTNKLFGTGSRKAKDEELPSDTNAEKVSALFKSMSQFSDLEFFLNPQKATCRVNIQPAIKDIHNKEVIPIISSSDQSTCASSEVQFQKWDIKFYRVKLSDNIVAIVNILQKTYLTILENDTELKKMLLLCPDADSYQLLRLPKERLMECIKKLHSQQCPLVCRDESIMTLITLYAIKQITWYLCFYGIHTTCLYLDKLYQNLEYLKSRLNLIQSLIEDAYQKADKEITKSHPSLSFIQGILHSNVATGNLKVMIVAERVFWLSLKKLLTSMGLSFNELQNIHMHKNHPDACACETNEVTDCKIDDLLRADCLIVSQEQISVSFPFNKFGTILEYGGSHGSSRISTISAKKVGLPCLYHLKMDLEEFSISKALCEGFDVPQIVGITMEGMIQSIGALHGPMNVQESKDKVGPVGVSKVDTCCMPLPVSHEQSIVESLQTQPCLPSFPGKVIVVNTQNFDKEMLISRRSTYQRILAMEKQGTQVVERDSNVPVDVIVSADICLVWYDCRNIGKKATTLDEASSCLPLCVEDIATNVLTLLSFTFSSCILVFEGEISFLAAIMESSDGLYAAAASLGIDLQLFCSYSAELTDEIILSCIGYPTELTGCLYTRMPESETLAESFLTQFPSINPLTAHAILSSGGILVEFLEWSHECRIQAIQKYRVPDESVALFGALCRYGEREDSRSGITECSSSVSSAPDLEDCHLKIESERKKQKCFRSPSAKEKVNDGFFNFESLNQFTNVAGFSLNNPRVSKQCEYSCMSSSPEMLNDRKHHNSSMENKWFGPKQGLEMDTMKNLSSLFNLNDSQMLKDSERPYEFEKPGLSLNDKLLGKRQRSDAATGDWHNKNHLGDLENDSKGEVINLNDSFLTDEDFSSLAKSLRFSPLVLELEEDSAAGTSKTARTLSFNKSSNLTFPTAAEINSGCDVWTTLKDQKQSLGKGIVEFQDIEFGMGEQSEKLKKQLLQGSIHRSTKDFCEPSFQDKGMQYGETTLSNALNPVHLQKGSSEFQNTELGNGEPHLQHQKQVLQGSMHRYTKDLCGPSFQEKGMHYGGTPLSNALNSVHLQKGSPWTVEFLNRVRERSKLRRQSLPCDRSGPCFEYSDNVSKFTKRKSPSILDFYKYQGASRSKKVSEQKRQKRPFQPSSYKKGSASASFCPTWTPTDKRARCTLSFATNGSGSQTKLVWGDRNAQCLNKRF